MSTSIRERSASPTCPRYGWKSVEGRSLCVPWDQIKEGETSDAPWTDRLRDAAEKLVLSINDVLTQSAQVEALKRELAEMKRQIAHIQELRPIQVPINTFAPLPFELVCPVSVLVEPILGDDGEPCEYVASFVDGIMSATGKTVEEAVAMLKDRMAGQFKSLTQASADRLGRIPKQQLAALQSVMRTVYQ